MTDKTFDQTPAFQYNLDIYFANYLVISLSKTLQWQSSHNHLKLNDQSVK